MRRIIYPDTLNQNYITYLKSFERDLRARNCSDRTIATYLEGLRYFGLFLQSKGMPQEIDRITREYIEDYIAEQVATRAPNTAYTRYRALHVFFNWLVEEGELQSSPMIKMHPPKVPENPPEILTDDQLKAILKTCSGKDFMDRRDTAMIRLLIDTGVRREELTNIEMDDIDMDLQVIRIKKSKGGKQRVIVFGNKTGLALDRYIRARAKHPHANEKALWLGTKGKMTREGIYKAVTRRCDEAGIPEAYVHLFRHTFAHRWLAEGGSEQNLQRLGGWNSSHVMRRYGSSAADQRAREQFKQLSPGDKI